jgi:hypothetical protein
MDKSILWGTRLKIMLQTRNTLRHTNLHRQILTLTFHAIDLYCYGIEHRLRRRCKFVCLKVFRVWSIIFNLVCSNVLIIWYYFIKVISILTMSDNNKQFYDRTIKMWPFDTGDCLIEVVTTWAGLTVITKFTMLL